MNVLILEKLVRALLGFFLLAITSNYLSADEFGNFIICSTIAILISVISGLGAENYISTHTIEERSYSLLTTLIAFKYFIGLSIALSLYLVSFIITSVNITLILIALSYSISLQQFSEQIYYAERKYRQFAILSIGGSIITAVIRYLFLANGANLIEVGISLILEAIILNVILISGIYKKIKFQIDMTYLRNHYVLMWRFVKASMFNVASLRSDIYIMAMMGIPESIIGLYGILIRILESTYILASIKANQALVTGAELNSKSNHLMKLELNKIRRKTTHFGILLSPIICVVMLIIVSQLGYVLDFQTIITAIILSGIIAFNYHATITTKLWTLTNNEMLVLRRAQVALLANIILNILFIYQYGVIGAAVSTTAVYIFIHYLLGRCWEKNALSM